METSRRSKRNESRNIGKKKPVEGGLQRKNRFVWSIRLRRKKKREGE